MWAALLRAIPENSKSSETKTQLASSSRILKRRLGKFWDVISIMLNSVQVLVQRPYHRVRIRERGGCWEGLMDRGLSRRRAFRMCKEHTTTHEHHHALFCAIISQLHCLLRQFHLPCKHSICDLHRLYRAIVQNTPSRYLLLVGVACGSTAPSRDIKPQTSPSRG